LVELHVSVEAPPPATTVGYTVNVAMGTISTIAVTVLLVPPAPVQANE
jgi:hypothetical protein